MNCGVAIGGKEGSECDAADWVNECDVIGDNCNAGGKEFDEDRNERSTGGVLQVEEPIDPLGVLGDPLSKGRRRGGGFSQFGASNEAFVVNETSWRLYPLDDCRLTLGEKETDGSWRP